MPKTDDIEAIVTGTVLKASLGKLVTVRST